MLDGNRVGAHPEGDIDRQLLPQLRARNDGHHTTQKTARGERGELERSEVETLAAYVRALGGKLKIIADLGDKSHVLG
jgi:hypothetical protein